MFGIWLQPHTVFIRHFSLVIGAILGSWVIARNWSLLIQKKSLPLWLIVFLLLWVSIHLYFIGEDKGTQLLEYQRIWKKIALSIPFGAGLGISILGWYRSDYKTEKYWRIIYIGFLAPIIVYFVKYISSYICLIMGFETPIYLMLSSAHLTDPWGVSRAAYVFFCLPAYFIAMSELGEVCGKKTWQLNQNWMYLIAIIGTPLIMLMEHDRTGLFYCAVGIIAGILSIIKVANFQFNNKKQLILLLILLIFLASIVVISVQNPLWRALKADAIFAVQINEYDQWKHLSGSKSPPLINELGMQVHESNYDRIAWAIRGFDLILKKPLGYGLMTLSFGRLNSVDFPGSQTNMSHNGWMDFCLGYGIPGFLLIFIAILLVLINAKGAVLPWAKFIKWVLGFMLLVFFNKELSSEIFINALIFTTCIFSTACLDCKTQNS
ncbi:O-antigen ligase family protein [Polynucleobacter sp. AP-Sanab-80-C2]|nr:O-antigen ligase family protein [Polynucleobacter sp. AP-Sanab-80-C2]